ncbi:MAG TPA: tetratricopeptide repeat protein [Bryobacteraceae bacterium]|jgi:serine/threonine-protein kinase
MTQPRLSALQHSAIRRQLDKITAHGLFARSDRMARFLRLAVDRALAGKEVELKEYLIGVEVFDRPHTYDPRVDPIVRVEARRLRSKLKTYYETDGRNDSIVFHFATGSYAPDICFREDQPAAMPEAAPRTMAVLPFSNLSQSADNDYFSDGLTEELIHALTKFSGMRVVAWNSAARMRGTDEDVREVRRQLHVANVLTGSVRIAGQSLRVRAQLIDTATGVYLWSETFDRQMQDVFAIQEEIARAIVRTLRVQLEAGADTEVGARRPTTVTSYEFYLKGRYHLHRRTPDELQRALEYFQAAVAADGSSGLAYAGLADGYCLNVDYGLLHPAEGFPKIRAAASRAIEIDAGLAEAYPSLAVIRSQRDREWEDAERLYRKAIALNPGYATAHHWLATDFLAVLGRFEEATEEIEVALELDPLSSIIHEGRASFHTYQRRYEEAVQRFRELVEFDPSFYKGYTGMGRAYAQLGNYAEARAMFEKGRALAGDVPNIVSAIGQVLAASGDASGAYESLAQLTARARETYVPSTSFALLHLSLGETERALDWLETGCEQHELTVAMINVHPVYDPLRAEPRFQALLRQMRFP